jgi:hypothetical protein
MNRSVVWFSEKPVNFNLSSQQFEAIQPDGLSGGDVSPGCGKNFGVDEIERKFRRTN